VSAQTAPNGENFVNRDFAIELPTNYDPTVPYPVYFGAGGCSAPPPPEQGPGWTPGGVTGAIQVGLQQISGCFADGGVQCASVPNVAQCVNSPELPYFLAVRDWVEANFCVDRSREFLGGLSSGAWLAFTLGCAAADSLRGTVSVAGGKREHRWPCDGGSVAALMVVSANDTINPVGPLQTLNTGLDSYGSAPARDDLLKRNGCVGTATAPYDPKFPVCVKYTGCPAAFPVVWCPLGTASHAVTGFNGVDYAAAMWPFLSGLASLP
jgi:poly(3-hydroxybutyrate) depolymerase